MSSAGIGAMPWLTTPSGALALSQLALAWMLVMYVTFSNRPLVPRRADASRAPSRLDSVGVIAMARATLLFMIVCALFRPATPAAIAATLALSIAAAAVTWARAQLAHVHLGQSVAVGPKYAAELELIATSAVLAAMARAIEGTHAVVTPLIEIQVTETRLAVIATAAATYVFAAYGCAHVVRGVLEKASVLPRPALAAQVPTGTDAVPAAARLDDVEYNRGRLIGMIERIMLLTLVAAGSYEAMGFITAAKGLIRSKELEDRAFAEYFLIGTLTSVAMTLPLGLLLRWAIRHW
jgi:hypothetical protein